MRKIWKYSIGAAAALILALVAVNWIYHAVSRDEWDIQRAAVAVAYEKTALTKTNWVERFVGDKTYTVISGEDKLGRPLYVWVGGEGELRSEMAASGVDGQALAEQVKAKHAGAEILRVTPGIQNDKPVWEIFYKYTPEGQKQEQHFYDYYQFYDGAWIDTWRLSIQ
ncbi:Uncharacterized protein YpmB [Paenibacillus sp. UNCCL117]|uniref:cell wall elongation regulator TseB-like domain-containing protein n=1 Tax=unclassified Paenibacillus TaxID=185978 RepID=UPI00088DCF76|nr:MULTISPECIES: DUF5590 domain-containing protein [unclassified Paenibacillus]SDC42117.1 Uncharacterized protein YpmB [Paenibacillus sp. cl123]SFW13333.1 Uncharacterized protein YpmB [Paenibacillus sp. UNCCL117]